MQNTNAQEVSYRKIFFEELVSNLKQSGQYGCVKKSLLDNYYISTNTLHPSCVESANVIYQSFIDSVFKALSSDKLPHYCTLNVYFHDDAFGVKDVLQYKESLKKIMQTKRSSLYLIGDKKNVFTNKDKDTLFKELKIDKREYKYRINAMNYYFSIFKDKFYLQSGKTFLLFCVKDNYLKNIKKEAIQNQQLINEVVVHVIKNLKDWSVEFSVNRTTSDSNMIATAERLILSGAKFTIEEKMKDEKSLKLKKN